MRMTLPALVLVAFTVAIGATWPAAAAPRKLTVANWVADLAASPDGRWLAAAPDRAAPVLFHVAETPKSDPDAPAEPKEPPPGRRELGCPPASSNSLAFTPDSKYLAIRPKLTDAEMTVYVFSTETAECVLEIDCKAEVGDRRLSKRHVWSVCPGPGGSQFYVARRDGLELWDAEKEERLWKDAEFSPIGVYVSRDGSAGVASAPGRDGGVLVVDPADGTQRRAIGTDVLKGKLKKPRSKKQALGSLHVIACGISPDGAVLVVVGEHDLILDKKKYSNPEVDLDVQMKAVKTHTWIEALDAATGESIWLQKITEWLGPDYVRCVGERVCVKDGRKLKILDIRTGRPKGTVSASKAIEVATSSDGETWWYGDEKGAILRKK